MFSLKQNLKKIPSHPSKTLVIKMLFGSVLYSASRLSRAPRVRPQRSSGHFPLRDPEGDAGGSDRGAGPLHRMSAATGLRAGGFAFLATDGALAAGGGDAAEAGAAAAWVGHEFYRYFHPPASLSGWGGFGFAAATAACGLLRVDAGVLLAAGTGGR